MTTCLYAQESCRVAPKGILQVCVQPLLRHHALLQIRRVTLHVHYVFLGIVREGTTGALVRRYQSVDVTLVHRRECRRGQCYHQHRHQQYCDENRYLAKHYSRTSFTLFVGQLLAWATNGLEETSF